MSAIDDVIQETAAVVDAAVNSVNLTVLQPEGLRLFGMLAGLAFILAGYKVFVRDEGSHKLFVQLAWTSFLIFLLSWFVGDGYLFIFDESINQSFNRIADKLLPGSSNGSAWTAAMSIMWDALQKIAGMLTKIYQDVSVWDTWTVFFKNLVAICILLFAVLVVLIGMVMFMTISTASSILVNVALIIGPVLIPWAMFNVTAFLFVGWLRLFVASALIKVVGAAVLYFASKILAGFAGIIAKGSASFAAMTAASIGIASLEMSIVALIVMVIPITRQLVSAPAGEIGFKFSLR